MHTAVIDFLPKTGKIKKIIEFLRLLPQCQFTETFTSWKNYAENMRKIKAEM
jgi:hypothetical protein